ncbi:ecto-NOX disulfide-thiol exchanger 2-like [Ruditapes philippinarum]|uniref:ecto-NOX disulfide-thiol exchanger 2-like n=1 Tax=Ruditapes philippinarum TaxID=129788 RepID=UPI00295B87F4|nr:ecto-NOX disulfide-thiol exchanger 2-like [Ruditapes philippinarum]
MMGMGIEQGYMNNEPLAFNANKGKPPMPSDGKKDDNSMNAFAAKLLNIPKSERQFSDDGSSMTMPPMPPAGISDGNLDQQNMMMQGGQGFFPMGGMGPMMGMMGPGPSPEMMSMGNMMMFPGMGWGPGGAPMGTTDNMQMAPVVKEIIRMKNCVLYPPPPNAPPPTTRERPPGCRTIFVGGLPETCTEEILQEVFGEFGPTTSVRKSKKKNFAHVRFEDENSIDRSLFLSGYRMKIEDKDDKANTGRLHVDFAMARDDQYEFECKQRALMRDMRHRQRVEEERLRPPSPPPISQYSDYEASALSEKLKSDEDFMKASQVLLTWLERGDVSRRNINTFYSMIQCTNSHIRRLLMEKQGHEEELLRMKEKFKSIFEGILRQFDQIEKIFTLAQKQRNWDHFTKAQRKNIELWLKQAKEIKQNQQEEFFSNRQEAEMEMSDDDEGPTIPKRKKPEYSETTTNQYVEMAGKLNQLNMLKDENDDLKCQMEAFKNELELYKQEKTSNRGDSEKEVKALQMAMQGMQQQLITARTELTDYKKRTDQEKAVLALEKQSALDQLSKEKAANKDRSTSSSESTSEEKQQPTPQKLAVAEDTISSTGTHVTEKEAQLVGLVCCFLHVHPTGASLDYIWSYLHRLGVACRVSELETLLEKMSIIFRQEVSGVGATIERRWHFTGYRGFSSSSAISF